MGVISKKMEGAMGRTEVEQILPQPPACSTQHLSILIMNALGMSDNKKVRCLSPNISY
jgi:hypothetical protein